MRLQTAPLTRAQVLGGQGARLLRGRGGVQALLFAMARGLRHPRALGRALLAAAMLSIAAAFVGLMMIVAAIGRNEQATSAAGWALLMPLIDDRRRHDSALRHAAPGSSAERDQPGEVGDPGARRRDVAGFGCGEMLLPCGSCSASASSRSSSARELFGLSRLWALGSRRWGFAWELREWEVARSRGAGRVTQSRRASDERAASSLRVGGDRVESSA